MAVGIGKDIKTSELEVIAGDKDRVVNAKNFDDLNNQLEDIKEKVCSKFLPSGPGTDNSVHVLDKPLLSSGYNALLVYTAQVNRR